MTYITLKCLYKNKTRIRIYEKYKDVKGYFYVLVQSRERVK